MTIPIITETQVKNWFDSHSFARGRSYYRSGHIYEPRQQGSTLKAKCVGTASVPYLVQVEVRNRGENVIADCTCPLGGDCKHCVALLLKWAHAPNQFSEVEEANNALADYSKEDLIKLIEQMVKRHPQLESLIEITALSQASADQPLDPEALRNQVFNAIQDADSDEYGYHHGSDIDLSGLDAFDDITENFVKAEQWFNVATISMTIIDALLDSYDSYNDYNGEISSQVNHHVGNLEQTLQHLTAPAERERVLRALFNIYAWDIDYGGVEMGYRASEIMLEEATSDEKQQLITWTQNKLTRAQASEHRSDWNQRAYGGLLLSLQEESLDDEAFIRICRESGQTENLIDRLLTLERVDEAVAEARKIENYTLLHIANYFVRKEHEAAITPVIEARAAQDDRRQSYGTWLKDRAVAAGDNAKALSILNGIFDQSPDLPKYKELAKLAQPLEQWETLRKEILTNLRSTKNYALLTQIHIEEKNVDDALRTVEQLETSSPYSPLRYNSRGLKLKVAEAAEQTHPRASIRIYLETAEKLIAGRGRGNYTEAASYLVKVRDLYQSLDQQAEWFTLIDNIRNQNNNLRAMHDEFDKAGLES